MNGALVWPPDVSYIKLVLNLLLIGLCVWLMVWGAKESIAKSRNLVALFGIGAVFVVGGVGFLWLMGNTNTPSYLLLLEIGIDGAFIVMGYSLLMAALIGLGKRTFHRSDSDA
jgi:hypothetical protein